MKYYKLITNFGEVYTRNKPSMTEASEYREFMKSKGYKVSELIFQYIEIKFEQNPIEFIKNKLNLSK